MQRILCPTSLSFDDEGLLTTLGSTPITSFDDADFGIVVMDRSDIVIGFRIRATPVRLRLLARQGSDRQYLAVRRR